MKKSHYAASLRASSYPKRLRGLEAWRVVGGVLTGLVCAMFFGVSWAHASDGESISRGEQRLRDALQKRAPEHLPTLLKAYDARQRGAHDEAASLYGEINAEVPLFAPVLRRQCLSLIEIKDRSKGVALCREALRIEQSAPNYVALSAALISTTDDNPWFFEGSVEEARYLIRRAVEMEPESVSAHEVRCRVGLALNSLIILRECSERLKALAPESVNTKLYVMYRALAEDDLDTAQEALNEARDLGMSNSAYLFLNTRITEARPFYHWWAPQLRAGVLSWALLVLVLVFVARLLDHRQRQVVAQLTEMGASVSRASKVPWRRWHDRFLWGCCMAYCITVPLLAILSFWLFGAAVYGVLDMELLPEQTTLFAAVAIFLGVGWLTRHFWRRPQESSPGTVVSWDEAPEANEAREFLKDPHHGGVEVLVMNDSNHVRVVEGGTLMHQLEGGRERRLELGRGALSALTSDQLQALLTSERRRLMNGAGFAVRVRRSMSSMLADLQRRGAATLFNPRWVLLSFFNRIFVSVSEGAVSYELFMADAEAAERYGVDTLEGALSLIDPAPAYDISVQARRARLMSLRKLAASPDMA